MVNIFLVEEWNSERWLRHVYSHYSSRKYVKVKQYLAPIGMAKIRKSHNV
jgi:hypothetical protein